MCILWRKASRKIKKEKKGSKKCYLKCPLHVKLGICMRIYFLQLANRRNYCTSSLIISWMHSNSNNNFAKTYVALHVCKPQEKHSLCISSNFPGVIVLPVLQMKQKHREVKSVSQGLTVWRNWDSNLGSLIAQSTFFNATLNCPNRVLCSWPTFLPLWDLWAAQVGKN